MFAESARERGMAPQIERVRSPAIQGFFQPAVRCYLCIVMLVIGAASAPRVCGQAPSRVPGQAKPPASDDYTSGINVEASQQLFATMCALDAAGFDADESTLAEMPSRLALRGELLNLHGPATDALRQFYRDHSLADPGETLSRFITFALVVGPPPDFRYQVDMDLLPPDVGALEGFQRILAAFYHEAQLDIRWTKIEPEYRRAIARYQPVVRRVVTVSNGYLREILKPSQGRTFTVYVEPLVGARTNFRNVGNQYDVAVGSTAQIPADQIQHAYLHFMIDPLPLRYRKEVESKNALLDIAARAPQLPTEYRSDFISFTDECMIKAVELRLRRLTPEQLEAAMAANDKAGFILVRPFVAQLQKFEKDAPSMTYYFPDIIKAVDVSAEVKRLKDFAFAPEQATPQPLHSAFATEAGSGELDRWLAEGDHQIALKDAPAASATFEKVLLKYPNEPRAMYGLAVASILSGEGERAQELFEQIVAPATSAAPGASAAPATADSSILAWSHVYLGRIHDLEDERDQAVVEYRAALAIRGSPENARAAAQRGLDAPYSSHATDGEKPSHNP